MNVIKVLLAFVLAFGTLALAPADAQATKGGGHTPISICHSGNGKHYVHIVVDDDATKRGHKNHKHDKFGLSEAECEALNVKPTPTTTTTSPSPTETSTPTDTETSTPTDTETTPSTTTTTTPPVTTEPPITTEPPVTTPPTTAIPLPPAQSTTAPPTTPPAVTSTPEATGTPQARQRVATADELAYTGVSAWVYVLGAIVLILIGYWLVKANRGK